jgi:hypothetical protein
MPYKDVETQKAYLRAYDRDYYRKNREHLINLLEVTDKK